MCKVIIVICVLIIKLVSAQKNKNFAIVGNPLAFFRPCKDNENITVIFEAGLPPEEENQYQLQINEEFRRNYKMNLIFDSDATVTLGNNTPARIEANSKERMFQLKFYNSATNLQIKVQGPPYGGVPYLTSLVLNTVEYCEEPISGFLDDMFILGRKDTAEIITNVPDDSCGRRKIQHTELIVNGQSTKPGDWPWHAAIYRLEKFKIDYICGGTLLNNIFVLTAAHCVTSRGSPVLPETRNVILGKYNLVGGDISPQEKGVHQIIVHNEFNPSKLDNDIALIKLKSEVTFSDYVQPACVWYSDANKKLPSGTLYGTVVGWGFDQSDSLSSSLQQVTIPKQSETTCIKSNPSFFSRLLNSQKFCAGFNNGTSACNGDSGGAFVVFVPDESQNIAPNASGAWYVRGIVSLSVSRSDVPICDPYQYVIFTDVAKYKGWLNTHMS
ncbi:unnamed protein product [Diatraea saccharalis]|uniref:Peptidase S1 domain-containing protein n=1 Tax=Diatraea saccharalis TaxID=40085 RepID=A0A9N9R9J8_9NEOP|nr:unnamed protein product [Diatraea saccharalis]